MRCRYRSDLVIMAPYGASNPLVDLWRTYNGESKKTIKFGTLRYY